MHRRHDLGFLLRGIAVLLALSLSCADADERPARPNVVVIMTDNHGAWTLGCYGNPDVRTPNIDRLAAEGLRFSRAFASNPVCSPTRATFLTGLLPSQHGVHSFLVGGRLQTGPDARCTLEEFNSLPEVLREAGYCCGLVGKWHLGGNLQPQEGFTDYWVTMPHGGTSTFYDAAVIENGEIRKEPEYLTDFWTRHAVRFIEQNAEQRRPFFLFLAYNGPYSLGRLLLREGRNRHAAYYADKQLPSFPREPAHPWQYNNLDYLNNPVSIRRVATEISGVDDGVGAVMAALRQHGLDRNTVVVFTADQGWLGGQGGFFGMGDHTRPVTARDGMMQVPLIWRHPGRIPPATQSDRIVSNYDFLPTLLSYLGLGERLPQEPRSPGRDYALRLHGQALEEWDDTAFYEFEGLRCIRTSRWKYIHRHPNGPHELYDLEHDPAEVDNLVDAPRQAATRDQLKRRLDAFFARHAAPRYDLWHGGTSQSRTLVGVDEPLVRHAATEPPSAGDFQPADVQVPEGFVVELAAAPPLVTHPTLACFDDRGRLFVCNNAGVNLSAEELEKQLPNAILLLEDTDEDGRFDRSTVFADKMTYPMGGAWHNGALFVASPPYIWRLEDTDDDGVADRREILVSEFGYTGNAASIHGCFLGPDGRLYWCDGYHGHEFRDASGQLTSKREGSYLFSCRTDGSDVRIHCGGGMDNPVEVDFTEEGELLGTVNILYTRPRVDCFVHWLYGGAYPHRERVLEELQTTGDLLGPVHRFGHVAVSGTMRYRSGVLDRGWRDNFFVTFFNSGKVVRLELARDGSTFRAIQREFLSSSGRDFHPTDVLEDADGSLLVVDTGGWFYRGCPTSQLAKPDIQGAIYRVRRRGMTAQVDPWGRRIDWGSLSADQLVASLNDTRHRVRERALAECAARGDKLAPPLRRALERGDTRHRKNAVWALTRILGQRRQSQNFKPVDPARDALRLALVDRDASVRLAACRSLATYPDPGAREQLGELLARDTSPAVRREAAQALGRLGDVRAVPGLLDALEQAADRTQEHSLVFALIETNLPGATQAGLSHRSARTRRGALIALDQMKAGRLEVASVAPLLDADDEPLRKAAVTVFARHADQAGWARAAASQLRRWLADEASLAARSFAAGELISTFAGHESVASEIGRALSRADLTPQTRNVLLRAISRAHDLRLHPGWVEAIDELLDSEDPSDIELALDVIASLNSERFQGRLQQISNNVELPPLLRVAAMDAAAGRSNLLSEAAFELLLDQVRSGVAADQFARAAQRLGSSALTPKQLQRLAPRLAEAGPMQLRDLIRPFQRSSKSEVAETFLSAVERAPALLSLPPNEFSDVIKGFPPEWRPRANALLEKIRQREEQRLLRIDQLLPLLAQGDAGRGAATFVSPKSKCSECHRVNGRGGLVGPDLSTIGQNRSPRDLLESIVFPSASMVRQYEPYSILTSDGRILSGVIVRENRELVVVQPQTGEPLRLPRDEIEELRPSTVSIMPNGLDDALSEGELADVIAYLMSLRGAAGRDDSAARPEPRP